MRLLDVRVRNFRSVAEEQLLPLRDSLTIVGPNNSGKTNILRAIQLLFTGHDNLIGYRRARDLFNEAGKERTAITVRFDGDPAGRDAWFYKELDELHKLQGTKRTGNESSLNLYFTESDTPVYNFFPNIRRPTERKKAVKYSKVARDLVTAFLESFSVHYVPSDKSVENLYRALVVPFLRESLSSVLDAHRDELQHRLDEASAFVSARMQGAGCGQLAANFTIPNGSVSRLLSHFDFNLSDPLLTPYFSKGMGVQAAAIFATLSWITHQEVDRGRSVIWLLEEPESYLHPSLSSACERLLAQLAQDATVVRTTHSLSFVPLDPRLVRGAERKGERTVIHAYKTSFEAGASIRNALGVKFGDYYGLGRFNVFFEGPSDRETFRWALDYVPKESHPFTAVRDAVFQDFGGVKHLSGFLRATFSLFCKEVASIAVFDGDDAGVKERRDLQQYFGQKQIRFVANEQFVSVRDRFALEGLFPDGWIIDLYEKHPTWFEHYSVDAAGALEPFRIKDDRKTNALAYLKGRAEKEQSLHWAERFIQVLNAVDVGLAGQDLLL